MTLQDLYNAVAQLGFEDSLEEGSDGRFIYATNRALIEINALRPRRSRVTINHRVPNNLLFTTPTQIEKLDEDIELMAINPKSFYFEVCGNGSYAVYARLVKYDEDGKPVKDEDGTIDEITQVIKSGTFNSRTFEDIKGIINVNGASILNGYTFTGEVFIKFTGDYAYLVRNIALYDRIYSNNVEDIPPFRSHIPYNINDYTDDFDHFDASPFEASDGKYLSGDYAIEGSDTILLPISKSGTYTICYIHKVKTYDRYQRISDTEKIDLDEDLATLAPILVASYVWLDDEAEKSQYYLNLYMQRAAQIQRESKDLNPVTFQSVYGW